MIVFPKQIIECPWP